jgi:peptide/nickel transport system substrate-binding protein
MASMLKLPLILATSRSVVMWLCLVPITFSYLSGCEQVPSEAIRFGVSQAPINLDPRFATDATSVRINRLLYERLVEFDAQFKAIPGLAHWQRLTPTHYRFSLTPGHRFSHGQILTSADVKATYDSVLDKQTVSPHRASLLMIEEIKILDTQTLDFILNKADLHFPGFLVVGILPSQGLANGHPFHQEPIGSGAFRLNDWSEIGKLTLQRLRDGQSFEILHVPQPVVRVLKLLRGEVDLLQNDLAPELVNFLAQKSFDIETVSGGNFSYLGFNLQDPLTGQLPIRQAVSMAIDRQKIIHYVLGGKARVANGILPPEHWAGLPLQDGINYQPEKSRQLLKSLGYDEKHPLRLEYKTSTDPLRLRIAQVLQDQLAAVNVELKISSYDWGTFYGDIKAGRFQMFSLAWVGIKTPDIFRYVFHSSAIPPDGANRGRYIDQQSDDLIDQAEQQSVWSAQQKSYRALQQRLLQQLPYVPLWYENHVRISGAGVTGYPLSVDGNYDGLRSVDRILD